MIISPLQHLYRISAFIILCLFVVSCANKPNISTKKIYTQNNNTPKVLLVNTNRRIERYQVAEDSFSDAAPNVSITSIDLSNDQHPIDTLQDILNEQTFDAIYCIGAKALGSIDYIDPDMPVVFSSVLNWRRFHEQDNYYGIASEISPEAQLTWLKYFFPDMKNIGVLYSAANQKLINSAENIAEQLSLHLVAQEINSETSLNQKTATLLSKVDVLWLVSDSNVLNSTTSVASLFELADQQKTPIFTYNSFFIDLGAILSITADLPTIGRQAAVMVNTLLSKSTFKGATVQFPAGSSITLNIEKIDKYNLLLNENALDSVDHITGME